MSCRAPWFTLPPHPTQLPNSSRDLLHARGPVDKGERSSPVEVTVGGAEISDEGRSFPNVSEQTEAACPQG